MEKNGIRKIIIRSILHSSNEPQNFPSISISNKKPVSPILISFTCPCSTHRRRDEHTDVCVCAKAAAAPGAESSAVPPAHGRHGASPRAPSRVQGSGYPRTRNPCARRPPTANLQLKPISTSVIHNRLECFPCPSRNNHRAATPKPRRAQTAARSSAACAAQLSRARVLARRGAASASPTRQARRSDSGCWGAREERSVPQPGTCGWLYNPSAGGRDWKRTGATRRPRFPVPIRSNVPACA